MNWNWSENCQTVFNGIKKIVTSDLSLVDFNPAIKLVVASDASEYCIGAVMLHKYKYGNIKAVVYASTLLPIAGNHFSHVKKEALVLFFAVKKNS